MLSFNAPCLVSNNLYSIFVSNHHSHHPSFSDHTCRRRCFCCADPFLSSFYVFFSEDPLFARHLAWLLHLVLFPKFKFEFNAPANMSCLLTCVHLIFGDGNAPFFSACSSTWFSIITCVASMYPDTISMISRSLSTYPASKLYQRKATLPPEPRESEESAQHVLFPNHIWRSFRYGIGKDASCTQLSWPFMIRLHIART